MPRNPDSLTLRVAMMYFIPWAIFLAIVILAVPVASWLEGRKARASFGEMEDEFGEEELGGFEDAEGGDVGEGEVAPEEGAVEEFGGDGGFGGEGDFGGEDFSEFEEVK